MTFPTVQVTVNLADITGAACASVPVTAKLDKQDTYDDGIVAASATTVTTDSEGVAVFDLFPNHPATGLGVTGSRYRFSAQIPGGHSFRATAQIPNTNCDIQDVMDLPAAPAGSITWAAIRAAFPPRLSANRDLYVDGASGDDDNDGSSGSPFGTITAALNAARLLDTGQRTFSVTVHVADAVYPEYVEIYTDNLILVGNTATPGNVVVDGLYGYNGDCEVHGLSSTSEFAWELGFLSIQDCAVNNITAYAHAHVALRSGTALSGNASYALKAVNHGLVDIKANVTVSGTPAYSQAFAVVERLGSIIKGGAYTFAGAATGARYLAQTNGVIDTIGGGANYFPGNSVGSTATGGQYA